MHTITIPATGLVLLSGPAGAGKTRLLKESGVDDSMIVSTDVLRRQLYGSQMRHIQGHWVAEPSDADDPFVFKMAEEIVKNRLKLGLLTFVDATLLTDKDRNTFVKLANAADAPCYTLIFDLPNARYLDQNRSRAENPRENSVAVADYVVRAQLERFQRTSEISDYLLVNDRPVTLKIQPVSMTVPDLKLDILGDTHGLMSEALRLLEANGYEVDADNLHKGIHHPDGRKLIVLGDFCDRGPDDLNMIRLMMAARQQGHVVLMGNHENKLARGLGEYLGSRQIPNLPEAATKVMAQIMELPEREQRAIHQFLKGLPHYMVVNDTFAFTHAPLSYFNPLTTPFGKAVYGDRRDNEEQLSQDYDQGYRDGHNRYVLIHGHIPHRNQSSEFIFSLDNHVGQGGDVHLLPLDRFNEMANEHRSYRAAYDACIQIEKSGFDFRQEKPGPMQWVRDIRMNAKANAKQRLFNVTEGDHGMMLVKYTPNVHFNNLWDQHPLLNKARGLVLNCAGEVLQHPFDKTMNFRENNTGAELTLETPVVCPVKLNGFLGVASAHPYTKKDLLLTTTGSFKSDFVDYFRESFTREEWIGMRKYTGRNPDVTLMFEVLHPDDPHIVKYPDEMMGVHLIGARRKDWDAPLFTEAQLDEVAREIGVRRPVWERTTFGEILERLKTFDDEGFMVRADTEQQEMILKLKSPYYLMTKFLGRLVEHRTELMFKHLPTFCQNLEEEGVMLASSIVSKYTLEQWQGMDQQARTAAVRELVDEQMKVIESESVKELAK
jgi:predicted kinase